MTILAFGLDRQPLEWLRALRAVRVDVPDSADSALAAVQRGECSGLVVDLARSGAAGEALLERLRDLEPSSIPPVVLCIDPHADPAATRGLVRELAVRCLLFHPLDRDELLRQLREALGLTDTGGRLQSSLGSVWLRFRDTMLARVATIEAAAEAAAAGSLGEEERAAAQREAHKLAGSAGTFGMEAASRVARELERAFAAVGPDPSSLGDHAERLATLRAILEAGPPADTADDGGPALPRLLVVDPDRTFAAALEREAPTYGLRVESAASAEQALAGLRRTQPDLVLLDLPAEGEMGSVYPLLDALSASAPPVPVIALAARELLMDRVEAARFGARAFVQKPVSAARLLSEAKALLQRLEPARPRLLAVDDDPQILSLIRALLERENIEVLTLEDPLAFWPTLEATAPDLLVLDVDMPSVSGIELCRVVRSDPRWNSLPALFLTARTDPETVRRVFAAGGDDFVAKPVVGPELVTRLRNRLERSQLLRSLSEIDPVTGIPNRRRTLELIERLHALARRHQTPLCFAVLDLDHFKGVNDRFGHAVGDRVLRKLAEILQRQFRGEDVVGRWGGEEFVLAMYGMHREDGERRLTEALAAFGAEEFSPNGDPLRGVSFSAGVSEYPRDGADLEALFARADEALYRAKRSGRARVLQATGDAVA